MKAVLIAGPTASGKSSLAMALAERLLQQGGAAILEQISRVVVAVTNPEEVV